jgi:HD-GYP domain-containing protein (c-di-GMP phosphodiesterase class II)
VPPVEREVAAERGTAGESAITAAPPGPPTPTENQWQRRPVLSALVRIGVVVLPAVAGIAAGAIVSRALPHDPGIGPALLNFALTSIVMLVVIIALERAGRRLLPLAALLNLSLLFPDRAPKRFAIARKVGKPKDLQRQLQEARDKGVKGGDTAYMQHVLELVAALSVHDKQTRGHSERVRVFADLIADEMNLSAGDRARLRWASLLHDIGKLVVPSAILTKPAALTDAEMSAVRRHPEEGQRLIGPLRAWLGEWGDAVVQHHERYDGKGYPHGLSGDQISLAGRIVAVADSYEVMTAARPYRKSLGVSAARQELVKCSGGQFDPMVVRAFLNISMGRLWRVVGLGSWVAQLSLLAWVQRLGWNWGAAALASGTTAISLTVPGILPSAAPAPATITLTPVLAVSGPSTQTPGATKTRSGKSSGTSHNGSSGSSTSGSGNNGTSSTPPPSPTAGTSPTPAPTTNPTPSPTPTPSATPTPTPSPTPNPDQPPVVTLKGGGVFISPDWTGSGSFYDASPAGKTFTAVVHYGDGTGTHKLKLSGNHFTLAHNYPPLALWQQYTVTVVVTSTDADGNVVSGSASMTVTIL